MIGRIAVENRRRHVGLELREIAFGEADALVCRLLARLGQHVLRGIDADHLCLRKALGEDARDVARTAAEIVDRMAGLRAIRRIEPAHQVERGPHPRIGELQVEVGIPARRRRYLVRHAQFSSNALSTGTRYAMVILLPFCAASTTAMNSSCISSVMPLAFAMAPCEAMQRSEERRVE